MKKIFIFFALLTNILAAQITRNNDWKKTGNTLMAPTYSLGSFDFPFWIIAQSKRLIKADSGAIARMGAMTSTAAAVNGSFWYDPALNGFVYFHNSNGSTNMATWTNSVFATSIYGVATTAAGYNLQITTTGTTNMAFSPGGSISLGVATNSIELVKPTRVGSTALPTRTLDVSGNFAVSLTSTLSGAVLCGNTFSATSTSSVNGVQLVSGGFTVTTKAINTTAGDAATINSTNGRFRKDNTGATFVLTNSQITANSIILLTFASDPGATGYDSPVVTAIAGSATITFKTAGVAAAPTNNTDINFFVIN